MKSARYNIFKKKTQFKTKLSIPLFFIQFGCWFFLQKFENEQKKINFSSSADDPNTPPFTVHTCIKRGGKNLQKLSVENG